MVGLFQKIACFQRYQKASAGIRIASKYAFAIREHSTTRLLAKPLIRSLSGVAEMHGVTPLELLQS